MASVRKETLIDASPDAVWDALRDWGAVHERLVPGFVVDCRLDGEDRIVTFFTGTTVRELLVDLDEFERRLVWSVVEGPYTHHNGCAQVFAAPDGRARFVWIADLLPHDAGPLTDEMMERGIRVLRDTLEADDHRSHRSPSGSASG
jgi:Polyketide cyclase / dehydrase and lipid transport